MKVFHLALAGAIALTSAVPAEQFYNQTDPLDVNDYGGDFPWVNKTYKMVVHGWSPLALLEDQVAKMLNWTHLAMATDGNFFRPGEENSRIFPTGGTVISWRYDGKTEDGKSKVVFDFMSDSDRKPWGWRFDTGEAVAPYSHWDFVGHVKGLTFGFTMDGE